MLVSFTIYVVFENAIVSVFRGSIKVAVPLFVKLVNQGLFDKFFCRLYIDVKYLATRYV